MEAVWMEEYGCNCLVLDEQDLLLDIETIINEVDSKRATLAVDRVLIVAHFPGERGPGIYEFDNFAKLCRHKHAFRTAPISWLTAKPKHRPSR